MHDAPGVLHGHIQVHISQAHIPGHTCASLAAHPGECALKGGWRARQGCRRWHTPLGDHQAHQAAGSKRKPAVQVGAAGAAGEGGEPALGSVTSSCVGRTVRAREECGPACDSGSARDAGERLEKNVSNARSSQAWAARRCHPRRWASAGGRMASSQLGTV